MYESDLELSGVCDIKRLCMYWAGMDKRIRSMFVGYYMFTKWHAFNHGMEAMNDMEMLLDVADMIAHPEHYQEAA